MVIVKVVFVSEVKFKSFGFVRGFFVIFCIIVFDIDKVVLIKVVVILWGRWIFWMIEICLFILFDESVSYIFFIDMLVVLKIMERLNIMMNMSSIFINLYKKGMNCWLFIFIKYLFFYIRINLVK